MALATKVKRTAKSAAKATQAAAAAEATVKSAKTAAKATAKPAVRNKTLRLKARYDATDLKATGPMPEWDDMARLTPEQHRRRWNDGMYFYYYHHDIKELRPFIVEVLGKGWSKDKLREFNKIADWMVGAQLGAICKMVLDGAAWPEGVEERSKLRLEEAFERAKLENEREEAKAAEQGLSKKEVVVPNIQDRIKEIRDDIIGGIDQMEDDLAHTKKLPPMNIMAYLRAKNCPQQIISYMEEMFAGRLAFILEAKSGKDAQLKEGYASYKKKDWDNWIAFYNNILTDLDGFKRAKVAARPVRLRKPPTPEKLVRTLKYMREFPDLGLVSVKPTEIIHATQLWVYNTKTRKLGVYNASDMDKELTVKGSTILGWDPKTSVAKTLRKPADQLKEFANSGKVQLRTFLSKVKATEINLNGRINADTILLRVNK